MKVNPLTPIRGFVRLEYYYQKRHDHRRL